MAEIIKLFYAIMRYAFVNKRVVRVALTFVPINVNARSASIIESSATPLNTS